MSPKTTLPELKPWTFLFKNLSVAATVLLGAAPLASAQDTPVSFRNDIAPVLAKKCVACHSPEKTKGGFQLHTFAALSKGADSKSPTVTAGQPEKSELFLRLVAPDPDDRMPQKDDPLPPAQIALIRRWIQEGAKFDGPDPSAPLATLIPREPHPLPPEIYPHPVPVLALAFSPDGREVATGGYHEILFWNSSDGKLLRRLKNLAERTQHLAYSPDGSWLAAASGTPGKIGEIKLFHPRTGEEIKTLVTTPDAQFAVVFSPDGARLAAGGADNAIRIFNVASGAQERLIEQHADWVFSLAWSPDGARIASASRDKSARLFDAATGQMEHAYLGHNEAVFDVVFSPDGKRIISAGRDKKIHLWQDDAPKKASEISGFDGDVLALAGDGPNIFSAGADKKIRQHSIAKGELVRTFSGHHDWVYSLAVNRETGKLASGGYDGEVRIWSLDTGKLAVKFFAAPGSH